MISLHDYSIAILSKSELTRRILPHIFHILGKDCVSFFSNARELASNFKKISGSKLIIFDGEEYLEEIMLYQDKLIGSYLFVLVEGKDYNSCTVEECLDTLKALEKQIFTPRPNKDNYVISSEGDEIIEDQNDSFDLGDEPHLLADDFIYKPSDLPFDRLTIYRIDKPLTMRGIVNSLKTVLPQQTVGTEAIANVSYELLENDLKKRYAAYEASL